MRWWARLLRRDAAERELDAELRYDFDRRVEDFVRRVIRSCRDSSSSNQPTP